MVNFSRVLLFFIILLLTSNFHYHYNCLSESISSLSLKSEFEKREFIKSLVYWILQYFKSKKN